MIPRNRQPSNALGRNRLPAFGLLALTILTVLALVATFAIWGEIPGWTILVGVATSVPCAVLGCYLVLRKMSLLGDAISHAILPGIAVGFLLTHQLGGPGVFLGAIALGLLTALLTQTLSTFGKVPEDASLGAVFTSLFAVGVILITNAAADVDLDPGCVLYGLIDFAPIYTMALPGIGLEIPRALGMLLPAGLLTAAFVGLLWKELKLASFDPMLATAVGINATLVHYLLMAMVAGVTVASFEAVGAILVVAMLIVPGATGHLLSDRLGGMLAWAVFVAVVSAFLGYIGAVVTDSNVAGMMAVAAGAQFALAVVFAPRHGVLVKSLHNLALSLRIAGEDVLAMLYRNEEKQGAAITLDDCRRRARAVGGRIVGALSVSKLRRGGLLLTNADGLARLSEKGRAEAHSLVRSHRLWESYLDQHFHLPPDHLHEPAEWLEHFIGPQLQKELTAELQRPQYDPHGRQIPEPEAEP
ncbi:iron chelate uptake ABC transporter family permease subunit [soil metagenome]